MKTKISYEKELDVLETRRLAHQKALAAAREDLHAQAVELAAVDPGVELDKLAVQYTTTAGKCEALTASIAEIENQIKATRLAIVDLDLAETNAEISELVTENSVLREKQTELRKEFRKTLSSGKTNTETKARVIELKNEIAQAELAGNLLRQQLESAKRKRDKLQEDRAEVAA